MGQHWITSGMHKLLGMCIMLLFLSIKTFAKEDYKQGNKKVTIVVENTSRKEIIRSIEKQTGMSFFYRDAQLHPEVKISMSFVKRPLDEVVAKLLEGTGLTYEYNDYVISIKPMEKAVEDRESAVIDSSITSLTLSGKVVAVDGKPIPGATVIVKRTMEGGYHR